MDLEIELDRLLKIKTNGRDDTNSDLTNYPYEPTPYAVLEMLANSGYIKKTDVIIDYGCGKGRVDFYLAYMLKCRMIGIEYDLRLFNKAQVNHNTAISKNRVDFIHINANDYEINDDVTGLYFFNPFSIAVLKNVLNNLRDSIKKNKRSVMLYCYYPSSEYLDLLDNAPDILHIEDIDCTSLYKKLDKREIIAVYKI